MNVDIFRHLASCSIGKLHGEFRPSHFIVPRQFFRMTNASPRKLTGVRPEKPLAA